MIERFGSFYVGGRQMALKPRTGPLTFSSGMSVVPSGEDEYHIEQAYVQYFVPANRQFRTPVLFVHGGGLTGACWETTPDSRPGWLLDFLSRGIACYVVDLTERGRAGFCPFPGKWPGAPVLRGSKEAWSIYRIGRESDYSSKRAFEGHQFPVDAFPALMVQHVPRWLDNDVPLVRSLSAAIDKIGPCAVVAHSQGGGLTLRLDSESIRNIVAYVGVEPHGIPAGLSRHWALTTPLLAVFGDYLGQSDAWAQQLSAAKVLVDLHRRENLDSTVWSLPAMGIHGNSHMMMMDRNSSAIAKLTADWLAQYLQ